MEIKEEATQEIIQQAKKRAEEIVQKANDIVNTKAKDDPEINIETETKKEIIKLIFEDSENRMFDVLANYIESLQEYSEGMTLEELASMTDFVIKRSEKSENDIISFMNDLMNGLYNDIATFSDPKEPKEAAAAALEAAEKLAEINRISIASLNKRLNTVIKKYQEQIEVSLKKYLKDHSEESNVSDELLAAFIEALTAAETEEEPAIIYSAMHYLEKDQSGNLTPDAIEAEEILQEAYKKAIENIENGIIPTNNNYIESIAIPAKTYLFPVDKTANSLHKIPINGVEQPLGEEKQGTSTEINSYICFDFDEAAKETDLSEFTLKFTEFDKQVQESVLTLMRANNEIITPEMIHKTLVGNTSARITPNWENDINRSMRKFNSVFIHADLTELIKYYPKLKGIEKVVRSTRLMQFEKTYIKSKNGNEIMAYKMFQEPILCTIAEAKGQIAPIDMKLLANGKTSNSIDSTALKIYLLKRITAMKRAPKHRVSRTILYDTLYSHLNRTTTDEKKITRKNADKLLLQFKAEKYIENFETIMQGRKAHGIGISLFEDHIKAIEKK